MNYNCDECETDMVRDPVLSAIDPRHDVHLCPTCGAFLVVKTDGTAGPIGTVRNGRWTDAVRTDGTAGPMSRTHRPR